MHNRNLEVRICATLAIVLLIGIAAPVGAAPIAAGDGAASPWDLVVRTWQTTIDSIFASSESDDVQGPIMDPDGQQLTAPTDDLDVAAEAPSRPLEGTDGK